MKTVTLLTGGGRSGKSRHALELAQPYACRAFIATAVAFDTEMSDRIAKHREERANQFTTLEEPVRLDDALRRLPPGTDVAIIDCITVWLGNLMYHDESVQPDSPPITALLTALRNPPCDVILVTNEVGLGIIPDNAMARRFRDLAGSVNQRLASAANRVIFMVSGLPLVLKETPA
jgi:adenosylcobinamide kinase/adenosylcobinamide-phosphate guanylyltransferase